MFISFVKIFCCHKILRNFDKETGSGCGAVVIVCSAPVAAAQVSFPDFVPHVDWVCQGFLSLLRGFVLQVLWFSSPQKPTNSNFQFFLETLDNKSHLMEYQLVQKLLFDQFPLLIYTFIVLKLFSHHKSPGSIFTSLLQQ